DSFQNLRAAIDLLVSKGALLDAKDPKNGETPLIKIVRNAEDDQSSLISFIQNEPDLDAVDNEGNTALMWATTLTTMSGEVW
ncbi:ankyrin repeat domain-containing protein, partial [Shewanella algae]|uniref:ankyrin repeat domain-containing protein n=1 Tax=Shewanella algae TaxID=38313 RepID=UPI00313DA409